ncbi:molybdenum cofactor biosynthesis protein MoaE [Fulvimarina manganoxydans]|uniref:molybdenum cofactor biosynthesis protein MoaE n=1 Tax=Fulvimarina manganoxydans TaxID=937218 RepID=UPI00308110B7
MSDREKRQPETLDTARMASTMYDAASRVTAMQDEKAPRSSSKAEIAERSIRVQAERIDLAQESAALVSAGSVGATVGFTGYCRDEDGRLSALELEHYPGMAERAIGAILDEAAERWPLLSIRAVHRYGLVKPGEEIVFVGCASAHRQAAFEAAEFVMDFMKSKAPFWKREHLADGSVGGWVESKATDEAAGDRWHRL